MRITYQYSRPTWAGRSQALNALRASGVRHKTTRSSAAPPASSAPELAQTGSSMTADEIRVEAGRLKKRIEEVTTAISDITPRSDVHLGFKSQLEHEKLENKRNASKLELLYQAMEELSTDPKGPTDAKKEQSPIQSSVDWKDRIIFKTHEEVSSWKRIFRTVGDEPVNEVWNAVDPSFEEPLRLYSEFVPQVVRPADLPCGFEEVPILVKEKDLAHEEDGKDHYLCSQTTARVFWSPEPKIVEVGGDYFECKRSKDIFSVSNFLGRVFKAEPPINDVDQAPPGTVFGNVTEPIQHALTDTEVSEALRRNYTCTLYLGDAFNRNSRRYMVQPVITHPQGIRKLVTGDAEPTKDCWITEKRYPRLDVGIILDDIDIPHFVRLDDTIFTCSPGQLPESIEIGRTFIRRPNDGDWNRLGYCGEEIEASIWTDLPSMEGLFRNGRPITWHHGGLNSPEHLIPLMQTGNGQWSFRLERMGQSRKYFTEKTVEMTWFPDQLGAISTEPFSIPEDYSGPLVREHRWQLDIPICLPFGEERIRLGEWEISISMRERVDDDNFTRYNIDLDSIKKIEEE